MDAPKVLDNYMKESIDQSLGLPVSNRTLQLKLLASQESLQRITDQYHLLLSKVREKDQIIELVRAEASMNALAVKRFVEENQRLADECRRLLNECSKWERECSLYDHDREALMEFGNEADERAKEAETRVQDLEVQLGRVLEDLNYYKHRFESLQVDPSAECTTTEENLLEAILASVVDRDDVASGHAFLQANVENETCQLLLKMWNRLKPSTQTVVSLAAEVMRLKKDKEHITVNLLKAEEEVNLLSAENKVLDMVNKRLQHHRDRNHDGSGGKHSSSASAKSNKRKSSPKLSPIGKKIDFDLDPAARSPLSPLRHNSPDSRMQKK